ncbi:hypothetical protein [Oceanirhabdus sp. W0125-5]|uniref:hypothetical protein n=1 Tax=Oceanirhabdus sp. W0125-5 TaxID=2999116 RepID=UPI0022F2FEA9|nr:hypothetical protein [Oceanirhabdus sp. W0125-5]WBW96237.1 hypothetical protein OW730_21470 [Oceanirhabdus sp. W0125-5]
MYNKSQIIKDIEERMGSDKDDSYIMLEALLNITNNDIKIVQEIVHKEKWCNYYFDTNNYYELSCELVNDDCLWEEPNEDDDFYEFLLYENEEEKLWQRLKLGGWFVSKGVAICLDDDIVGKYYNNFNRHQ